MKPLPIVELSWVDIEATVGWMDFDEADEFITNAKNRTVSQVAYLLEEDEDQVVLVDSYTADGYGTINVIPRGCIKSIKILMELANTRV